MSNDYIPEYVKGQILVGYKDLFAPCFAEDLGMHLDFPRMYSWKYGKRVEIHQTPEGKEDEALIKFREYPEFVQWAEKRDIKLERRWKRLENYKRELESIDCEHFSDEKFEEEISRILKS